MIAAFRILADVLGYRLRRLEMANLGGALSILVALHAPLHDIAVRTVFALLLNVLVYLNNDYLDAAFDARAESRDQAQARFLLDHAATARALQWLLAASLVAIAFLHDAGLLLSFVLGAGTCIAYSAGLKRKPYLDVVAMMVWGFAMPAAGFGIDRVVGYCLAGQLALFSGVFQTIQVVRDHDHDAAHGVNTTAVHLGTHKTLVLTRILMVISAAYAAVLLHPLAGLLAALALALPASSQSAARYWNRVKLVYGLSWLVTCAVVFVHAETGGTVWSVKTSSVLAFSPKAVSVPR